MSDLCFCHLNGYKVKDAEARRSIEELNTKKADNETLNAKETEINEKIDGVKTDLNNLETRFNTMKVTGEAEYIVFKNENNGMAATDVQAAIEEVKTMASQVAQGTALGTTYDNAASKLEATNVQNALDELKALIDSAVGGLKFVAMPETEFDAIENPDGNTVYFQYEEVTE